MKGGTTFDFVTDGIEAALDRAWEAEDGKDVARWGGAQVGQQYLAAGLLDELELHVESQPDRTQRSETGERWFLVFLLEPGERRTVLERELAELDGHLEWMRQLAAEVPPEGRFRPVLDMGLRVEDVMADWLHEQIAATESPSTRPAR